MCGTIRPSFWCPMQPPLERVPSSSRRDPELSEEASSAWNLGLSWTDSDSLKSEIKHLFRCKDLYRKKQIFPAYALPSRLSYNAIEVGKDIL